LWQILNDFDAFSHLKPIAAIAVELSRFRRASLGQLSDRLVGCYRSPVLHLDLPHHELLGILLGVRGPKHASPILLVDMQTVFVSFGSFSFLMGYLGIMKQSYRIAIAAIAQSFLRPPRSPHSEATSWGQFDVH